MATRVEPGPPSSARPTGTVTFLFSDIEGSTSRWEGDRAAMASATARHDALFRAALEARDGYIFKTMGDAFCAVFARAQDAIAAALDAQHAIVAEDFSAVSGLHVRMALHTGTTDERDGDYFGPPVNRVARLLAIGHGGQVLVSGTAADLLMGEMPPQSSLRDLGAHRLKDLARPEQVYQLIAPDLPQTFPPLRSLDELPNNLPRQLTSFVGRDEVVAEVAGLIQKFPLVTLVGTGGAGKTRCAIQIGAELLDASGDGVWLVELASISDPALVANVIAQALNVQAETDRPAIDTLLAYLKRKRLLLILDNCEHVIDETRNVVGAILHTCPGVRILATSREGLNTSGEATYRMPSLAVPANAQTISAEIAARYGAVQLFVDRAFLSDQHFALTPENVPYVAEICRRLDGIPLAIELAAARVKVLSPQQLAQKLDERFRVLTGGDRSALPRQQTMRALIDWSYELLSEDERALFRKLSIFAGGFTLESTSVVCKDEAIDELAVLDLLSSLVDKSLVQAEMVDNGTRYRLLESTRHYAREKLVESGVYDAVARAHATAYLELAEELNDARQTMPDRPWIARAEPELENFRAALEWAFGPRGDALIGQRLAGTSPVSMRFGVPEARRWVQIARERADAQTPASMLALLDLTEAQLAGGFVQYKASLEAAERALLRYRELEDALQTARAERQVGRALIFLGRLAEGEALLTHALAQARRLGDRRLTAVTLENLAIARQFAGDLDRAREYFGEALAIDRSIGAEQMAAQVAVNLAEAEFRGGNAAAALRLAGETLAVSRAFNNTQSVANALCNIAAYLVALERYDEARTSAREGLAAARDAQLTVVVALTLQHLSAVAALQPGGKAPSGEELARAARILGYVDARLVELEALREYTEQQEYDKILPALREALGADELSKLMAEGTTWNEDQAAVEASSIGS